MAHLDLVGSIGQEFIDLESIGSSFRLDADGEDASAYYRIWRNLFSVEGDCRKIGPQSCVTRARIEDLNR
jgi:hypothetical protein